MKKKANKKGFTIMEMLIVVAIIAVLAAIAIPTFNGALTKSKEAADVANIRAAYAEIMVDRLTNDNTTTTVTKDTITAKTGKLNFEDHLSVANDKVTYTTTKLENSKNSTNPKEFTWSLADGDTTTNPEG